MSEGNSGNRGNGGSSGSGSGRAQSQGSGADSQGQSEARATFDAARTGQHSTSKETQGQDQKTSVNTPSTEQAAIRPGITYGYTHADRLPGGRAKFEEKAPNARKAFEAMRKAGNDPVYQRWQKQVRDNQARDDRIHQKPVTKAEREAREKLRAKPKLEHTLEIDGTVKRTVDNRAHAENERRLNFISQRMRKVEGKARADFDRSR